MDERRRERSLRRTLRAGRFRRNRRGVVAVVGSMLSLLVFFALFGVFITQYVPLWMSQNENQFSNDAQASIESLKGYVDDQVIFGQPHTYAVPFTLSSQGIPLFAQPTQGSLSYLNGCPQGLTSNGAPKAQSACAFENLSYWKTGVNIPPAVTLVAATNYLNFQLPNRYYPSQSLILEGDAVAVSQAGGRQWMLAPPPLNISVTGQAPGLNTTVSGSFVTLLGAPSSFSSQGSKDVYSTLLSSTNVSSFGRFVTAPSGPGVRPTPLPFNVTLTIGTTNPCAWYEVLYNLSNVKSSQISYSFLNPKSPLPYPTAPYAVLSSQPPASECRGNVATTHEVTLKIYNVNFAQAYVGQVELSFNPGGT